MLRFLERLGRGVRGADTCGEIEVSGRVYAVGDIHGRADLLLPLIEKILLDAADAEGAPQVVFMGDYVDRGDQSFEVLELLTTIDSWGELTPIFLLGNHEEMLLEFIDRPETGARWLRNGGLQTLMSYGITGFASLQDEGELFRLRDIAFRRLGPHLQFLRALQLRHRNGNVFFAHAGADPRKGLDQQTRNALLWGAPMFLREPRRDGVWVCHGHIVVDEPVVRSGRISIDTGAFFSGQLTAVRLGGGAPRFIVATDRDDAP